MIKLQLILSLKIHIQFSHFCLLLKHQKIHTKDVCEQMKKRRTASRMMTEGFDVEIIPEEGEEGGIMGFKVSIAEKDDD